jgi:hypothetical protein
MLVAVSRGPGEETGRFLRHGLSGGDRPLWRARRWHERRRDQKGRRETAGGL